MSIHGLEGSVGFRRRGRRVLLAVVLACCIAVSVQAAPEITIGTDRLGTVYAAGDTAVFLVKVTDQGQPVGKAELAGELSTNGFWHSEKISVPVADGAGKVQVCRNEPCILWIRLTAKGDDGKTVRKVMGAAFSPEKIKPSMPKPDDFDAVNFVRDVNVPAIVGTGFADLVCPSSSVYAAFNVMDGPKTMVIDPPTGHGGNKVNWSKAYDAFLREQGGLQN